MNLKKAIVIWKFEDAPPKYQALSDNCGDEDWIALVPEYFKGRYIGFLDAGTPFGCCCIEEHEVADGTIFIGCHS